MATAQDSKTRLEGIFNITVTPFSGEGIDFRALADAIERMIGFGFDGLLIGGTYGEFPVMSAAERAELFHRTMDVVGRRIPVLLCSAASDPRLTKELTELAVLVGGIPMVTAPFVSEVDENHIFEFFRWLAPFATSGLVIYNAPGIGITLLPRLIERLSAVENVIGLKQGDLNPTSIDELANRVGGKLRLFCASDLDFLGPLMAGFDGLSSTNSCAFPELILATYRAIAANDAQKAVRLHQNWYAFRALARRFGQPQTVKAAMRLRGWDGGSVRPPLTPLTPPQQKELAAVVRLVLASAPCFAEAPLETVGA
jgi:dihydrodipicolinate synthase/N-acetylneuraminate lyase